MERFNWGKKLEVLLIVGLIAGCSHTAQQGGTSTAISAAKAPAKSVASAADAKNTIPDANLLLTKEGVEFAGVNCVGAYTSQVSGVVKNEANKVTAKTTTSTCTTSGDSYVRAYTNMQYNPLGQMTGYNLKLSSSKSGKEYSLVCSNIMRDNLWEVVRYTVEFDGNSYQFQR